MVKNKVFSPRAFMLVAEEFNSYRQPQKPTDGCPSGKQRDKKTGKCKVKARRSAADFLDEAIALHQEHLDRPETATQRSQEKVMELMKNARLVA